MTSGGRFAPIAAIPTNAGLTQKLQSTMEVTRSYLSARQRGLHHPPRSFRSPPAA